MDYGPQALVIPPPSYTYQSGARTAEVQIPGSRKSLSPEIIHSPEKEESCKISWPERGVLDSLFHFLFVLVWIQWELNVESWSKLYQSHTDLKEKVEEYERKVRAFWSIYRFRNSKLYHNKHCFACWTTGTLNIFLKKSINHSITCTDLLTNKEVQLQTTSDALLQLQAAQDLYLSIQSCL